jgi:hypothetical protein
VGVAGRLELAVLATTPEISLAYSASEGQWIAVGDSGTIITSPDGTTWTTRTSNSTASIAADCS